MNAIFLCDLTTNVAQPFAEAGWDCWCVDMQHPRGITRRGRITLVGANVHELHRDHWWLPQSADFAMAFPDCTFLTNSANRWQRERGPGPTGMGLLLVDACWRLMKSYGCPWAIENPAASRLGSGWYKPDHTFHPWEYAGWLEDIQTDNTTKGTGIWCGNGFVMPEKRPAPEPHRHDCWMEPPGEDRGDIRSVTPMGFARAMFAAVSSSEVSNA